MLVLDSGGLSHLVGHATEAGHLLRSLRERDLLPAVAPTVVLVESLRGDSKRDANTNRFLKGCIVEDRVTVRVARRAAELRRRAGRGSVADAIVVALAEPGGLVLTSDKADLEALASHARSVHVEAI